MLAWESLIGLPASSCQKRIVCVITQGGKKALEDRGKPKQFNNAFKVSSHLFQAIARRATNIAGTDSMAVVLNSNVCVNVCVCENGRLDASRNLL